MIEPQALRLVGLLVLTLTLVSCGSNGPASGTVQDEALAAGRKAESLPAADEDYFKDMDGGGGAHGQ